MPLRKKDPIISIFSDLIVDLPSPTSISYMWNFGSLLGLCLMIQLITGIFLSMFYCSDSSLAFSSVIHIVRDVNFGWLLRYIHANGASFFFLCVYFHIARGMYYGSFIRLRLWYSGIIIFIFMMIIAFLGYVLPWGQMSFWGATVITNFFSAIPYIGNTIVFWIWGGFSVGKATLSRFYAFHYVFPFILVGLIFIHLLILHEKGSNNPNGISSDSDKISFHPYFTIKDLYGFFLFMILFSMIVFWSPNYLGDAENFISSNPLVTPVHIVPEWYFLFAYAILRGIPNKLGGLIALVLSLVVLFFLPFLHLNNISSLTFSPFGKLFFWLFISNFLLLTWLGSQIVSYPFLLLSQISSFFYFSYFLFFMPLIGITENKILSKI